MPAKNPRMGEGERVTDKDIRDAMASERVTDKDASSQPQYRTNLDTDMMRSWIEHGWSPEEVAMVARLSNAGLHIPLAAVAARQIMGLGPKSIPPDVAQWNQYEQDHPVMANSKKLLAKGSAPLAALGGAIAKPAPTLADIQANNERLSAHKMLKEYLMNQDQLRAGEARKQGLWMLARMPGQPLAGQPVYGGAITQPMGNYDLDIGQAQIQPQYSDLAIGPAQILNPGQARR